MSWERREERISGREQGQIELAGRGEGSLETVPCRGGVLVCWCDYEQQKISSQICKACKVQDEGTSCSRLPRGNLSAASFRSDELCILMWKK